MREEIPFDPAMITKAILDKVKENEKKGKIEFIQQALFRMNENSLNFESVNATVWLTKGNHFFFNCGEEPDYVKRP